MKIFELQNLIWQAYRAGVLERIPKDDQSTFNYAALDAQAHEYTDTVVEGWIKNSLDL